MISRRLFALPLCAASLVVGACQTLRYDGPRPALAVINARIWTGVEGRPWAEALAVDGAGRIASLGTTAQIAALGAVTVIDARQQMVVPGFIDAHVHFVDGGFALSSVQLRDAASTSEFITRIRPRVRGSPTATGTTQTGAVNCRGVTGSTR